VDLLPLSVLDLAIVANGRTSADALLETTEMARVADTLGYQRFWVAEHHNMETVASTSPPVLMAHLAAMTDRIRVGSGGVMLPNHAPLVVAEQFALLEALHPHRIDLGIGRAPGTDRATAAALRRSVQGLDEDFPRHLLDLMGLLGDVRTEDGLFRQFRATPVATSSPAVWLLGSSGFSAQLAGILGLPFTFANHFDMGGTEQAAQIYLDHFEPSAVLDHPHLMVSATVVVGDTEDEAQYLAAPSRLRRFALRTGRRVELVGPDEALAHPDFPTAQAMPSNGHVGTAEQVIDGLRRLRDRTGAVELMLYPVAHALADRRRSLEAVAAHWA
jgi:luciferase family oxidoreductase group 1